jgi:hypothetical protein
MAARDSNQQISAGVIRMQRHGLVTYTRVWDIAPAAERRTLVPQGA